MDDTPDGPPTRNAQAAACAYLLHGLLQREERAQPGFIESMIHGVQRDQAGVAEDVPEKDYIDAIFFETLKILRRAHGPFERPDSDQDQDAAAD